MNIDTEIRHITPSGANLFLELGFDPEDASRFHAEAKRNQPGEKQTSEKKVVNALSVCQDCYLK